MSIEAGERVNVLGVGVSVLRSDDVNRFISDSIAAGRRSCVLNVNVNCLNLAYENAWLRRFLNEAPVVFCDGAGVMLGARLLGQRIPERITYADWFWDLAGMAERRGFTMYFLGARPGVAAAAAARLRERHPRLQIVGIRDGYFDKRPDSPENREVIAGVNASGAHILVLGFGMPLQERWLMENWNRLNANIALTGGAVFDYVSGRVRRSPRWLNEHGLEWFGRLIIEPRRLWRRYLVGNPVFLWRVLKQRFAGEAGASFRYGA